MSDNKNICWIDIETTGLDPAKGLPLEVGIVCTDDKLEPLKVYAGQPGERPLRASWVCAVSLPILQATMSREVAEMHLKSGLLREVGGLAARPLAEIDALLAHFIVSAGCEGAPLAGSSVHFDRKWMERYFPLSLAKLHYRNIDVSVLLEMGRRKGWGIMKAPKEQIAHRVLEDLDTSISMMRFFNQHLLAAPPEEFVQPFWLSKDGVRRPGDEPSPKADTVPPEGAPEAAEGAGETRVEEVKPSGETKVVPLGTDTSKAATGGGATRVTTVLESEPVKMKSVVDAVPISTRDAPQSPGTLPPPSVTGVVPHEENPPPVQIVEKEES